MRRASVRRTKSSDSAFSSDDGSFSPIKQTASKPRRRKRTSSIRSGDGLDDSNHSCNSLGSAKSLDMDDLDIGYHSRNTSTGRNSHNSFTSNLADVVGFMDRSINTRRRSSPRSVVRKTPRSVREKLQGRNFMSSIQSPPLYKSSDRSIPGLTQSARSADFSEDDDEFDYERGYARDDMNESIHSYSKQERKRKYSGLTQVQLRKFLHLDMAKEQMLLYFLVFAIICFLVGCRSQAHTAATGIEEIARRERTMLKHLKGLEEQSLYFSDEMRILRELSESGALRNQPEEDLPDVDTGFIMQQVEQLRDFQTKLEHEVAGLQSHIQKHAEKSIQEAYGSQQLKAIFHIVDTQSVRHQLTVELWDDFPLSIWSLVQQVQNNLFDGRYVYMEDAKQIVVDAKTDSDSEPLSSDFEDCSNDERCHKRFTVSLSDSGIVFNMQSNKKVFEKDPRIGSIGIMSSAEFRVLQSISKGAGKTGNVVEKIDIVAKSRK